VISAGLHTYHQVFRAFQRQALSSKGCIQQKIGKRAIAQGSERATDAEKAAADFRIEIHMETRGTERSRPGLIFRDGIRDVGRPFETASHEEERGNKGQDYDDNPALTKKCFNQLPNPFISSGTSGHDHFEPVKPGPVILPRL